ncbi:MAG: HD domain-containing protein [Bacteroidetes bacterium]|nr:HD domain-containing protein [Bacteroidota bacterium]
MDYEKAKDFIINKLSNGLSPDLRYHNVDHTLDVLQSVEKLCEMENVNGHDLILLNTAALFHDSGMLVQYEEHEEASTRLTRKLLPEMGYTAEDIKIINKMILTTRLPQSAQTHLEKILCDADLDYLGRDDFFMIAHQLKYEWNKLNINKVSLKRWYELQSDFLETHTYYTDSAVILRQKKKNQNLSEVKELLIKHEHCI